jgi:hypothetical protein
LAGLFEIGAGMPADDATGPTGQAASIGFYANADDSLRVASETPRRSPDRPATTAVAPRGSALVVALATLLLAGTAIGFAWTLTSGSRQASDSAPATAPAQLPPEGPPAAELQPAAPVIEAPAPAPAAHLARPPRVRAARPPKPVAHRPTAHAATRRPHRARTDLADSYARAIDQFDRRHAQAAGGDPPF